MSDIFGYNRDPKPQAVFSSDEAHLSIEGVGEGYMIQQWEFNYQQNVQEIFELGSGNLYWVKGQPQGQGQIGRIVGGTEGITMFLGNDAYDICQGGSDMRIEFSAGQCAGGGQSSAMVLDGVVVTSFGINSSVQDMMIRQNLGVRFASMSI